jgi:hypothetical protein
VHRWRWQPQGRVHWASFSTSRAVQHGWSWICRVVLAEIKTIWKLIISKDPFPYYAWF